MVSQFLGLGLRDPYYQEVLDNRPSVGWFEVHTENFINLNTYIAKLLLKVREHYPISLHGVGLSLGSSEGICNDHLQKVKNVVDKYQPFLISEHISWSAHNGKFIPDLLPLPYNEESAEVLINNIDKVQNTLGRQILVENPSSYVTFEQSTMHEWEFINMILKKSGCKLLLDLNNVYVSCKNHKWDINQYMQNIDKSFIDEIHLAGPFSI